VTVDVAPLGSITRLPSPPPSPSPLPLPSPLVTVRPPTHTIRILTPITTLAGPSSPPHCKAQPSTVLCSSPPSSPNDVDMGTPTHSTLTSPSPLLTTPPTPLVIDKPLISSTSTLTPTPSTTPATAHPSLPNTPAPSPLITPSSGSSSSVAAPPLSANTAVSVPSSNVITAPTPSSGSSSTSSLTPRLVTVEKRGKESSDEESVSGAEATSPTTMAQQQESGYTQVRSKRQKLKEKKQRQKARRVQQRAEAEVEEEEEEVKEGDTALLSQPILGEELERHRLFVLDGLKPSQADVQRALDNHPLAHPALSGILHLMDKVLAPVNPQSTLPLSTARLMALRRQALTPSPLPLWSVVLGEQLPA